MTSFQSDPNDSILLKTKQTNPRKLGLVMVLFVLFDQYCSFPLVHSNQWRIYISCVLFIKSRNYVWRFSYWVLVAAQVSFRSHTQTLWILDSLVRHARTNLWLSWSYNPQRQRGEVRTLEPRPVTFPAGSGEPSSCRRAAWRLCAHASETKETLQKGGYRREYF